MFRPMKIDCQFRGQLKCQGHMDILAAWIKKNFGVYKTSTILKFFSFLLTQKSYLLAAMVFFLVFSNKQDYLVSRGKNAFCNNEV